MTMLKFGSICVATVVLYVVGGALAENGPGCVEMALYRHRAQNAASVRIAKRKCS
jgi:hypothetical protein